MSSHEPISSHELTGIANLADKPPAARRPQVYPSTRTISALTLVTLLALWWAVTAGGWIEPLFLPPPADVLGKGVAADD
ncbi:taurine ABC transporter permease, partial [Pseudomonas syringae pv. actinidiae]|nr:taurine ABC transporter permease [Pseudomonas syringae pv. actinidiae]